MVIQLHKQGAFGKGKILTTVKRDNLWPAL